MPAPLKRHTTIRAPKLNRPVGIIIIGYWKLAAVFYVVIFILSFTVGIISKIGIFDSIDDFM